ncbi:MAG: excalibur calcium-binding domain-containing protein [Actinomycetales bacterium]|nr:excalibur calcium-binding domain-containing protein [Actinomycetales bacterium]
MKVTGYLAGAAVVLSLVLASPAGAATTRFTSCEKMHRVYEHGISKDAKAQSRAVREGMHKPVVMPKVYADSYKSLDRDKDGTMCEVPS